MNDHPDLFALFDLPAGIARRDEGMARVADHNPNWTAEALRIIATLPRGWTGLPEDWRPMVEARIGPPTSSFAYGPLTKTARQIGLVRLTGRRLPMRRRTSNGRMTDEYERL